MTDDGWRYFCSECNDYHHYDAFYKAPSRPFGIFSSCSKSKNLHKSPRTKKDPSLDKIDTSYLKLNKVDEDDVKDTIDLLEQMGYNTTGNVHQQFLKKYQNEIQKALSKRHKNPNEPKKPR